MPTEGDPIDEFDFDTDLDGPGPPTFRATILGDTLTLNEWWPFLLSGGPAREHFRARRDDGVAIADLRRWREKDGSGELSVEFLSGGGRVRAERVIEGWARMAGYSRVWFPDRVVDLIAPGPPPIAPVAVTCPTCRATWNDESADFWLEVRDSGSFPRVCPVCGAVMPQWGPAEADDPGAGPGSANVRPRFHQERSRDPAH
ncbi:MAG: hypothetical protein H0V09_02800 [Gemmatimonadetes bacterium]|nr:hypothetical protein [Gemmatimonadota bacterium]